MTPKFPSGDPLGYVNELRLTLDEADTQAMLQELGLLSPLLRGSPLGPLAVESEPEQLADENSDHELSELRYYFHDRTGWDQLQALCRRDEFAEAAYEIHLYHGYCRLYGIVLPQDIQQCLTKHLMLFLAAPASVDLLRVLKHTISCVEELPADFDDAEPLEDTSHCTSILHLLMETWAVAVSLDEAFRFYLEKTSDIDSKLGLQYDKVLDALRSLDSSLQSEEYLRLLSVAVGLPLLENWRLMLAEPFKEALPWWLDGRLEEAALAIEREIQDSSTRDRPKAPHRANFDHPPTLPFQGMDLLTEFMNHRERRRLAASSGISPEERRLLDEISQKEYAVESDPDAAVRLDINIDETGQPTSLGLRIVPRAGRVSLAEVADRYIEARVIISGGASPTVVPLRRGYGVFTPPDAIRHQPVAWVEELRIVLVDRVGGSHQLT